MDFNLSGKKFLITGGAGFIGSNLVKKILTANGFARVFDNFSTGRRENIKEFEGNDNFELVSGDLRDFKQLNEAARGMDFIFHQAALPSVQRSIDDPITTNEVNILGTLNVLEAARKKGCKKVIYASSSSVYGANEASPKTEDMPVYPVSPYALSKYAGERYCQIYNKLFGLETVCLRYFNVFGPNQDPNSQYAAVVPVFIGLIKKGISPAVYGDGNQSRDFTYVENVVNANLLACFSQNTGGHVFNIACGETHSVLNLVEEINRIMEKDVKPVFKEQRKGEIKNSLASIEKARKDLSYQPAVFLKEGLEKLILGD